MANALTQAQDLEQIGDALSSAADALNEGIKDAVSKGLCDQNKAYAVLHDEQVLRSRANAIYFDAAQRVVAGLAIEQNALMQVVGDATDTLKKVVEFQSFLGILADLISLASAICAGQPTVILAAASALRNDIDKAPQVD